MLTETCVDDQADSSSDDDFEDEKHSRVPGGLKTFWELLYATVAFRARQATVHELAAHHPRSSIAPDLEPYVNSTRWPHDNTPLPAMLVQLAERYPMPFEPSFDTLHMVFNEPPFRFITVCSCGCLSVSLMFIIFFATVWCPTNYQPPLDPEAEPPAPCMHVNTKGEPAQSRDETVGCTMPPDDGVQYISIADACGVTIWRYLGLAIMLIVMGIPALMCLVLVLRLVWKQIVFYTMPLGYQQYQSIPVPIPGDNDDPEQRMIHHIRALTLLYTVHTLSRRPVKARHPLVPKWLWGVYHTHHFQWGNMFPDDVQQERRVWRFDVQPDGGVEVSSAVRRWLYRWG